MSLLLALAGATAPVNYTLACDSGEYVIAGQNASFVHGYALQCDAGAYIISGKAATLTVVQTRQEAYSGGYDYPLTRRKTKKEVYAERVKMGIVKEDIQQKAVEVVAKVQKVNYAPAYEYDPQQLVKQLMAELRVKVPSPDYTRAIELALRIAEQDEEEALLLLAY